VKNIVTAASVCWEGYVHTGCWYWASRYSSSAPKGCNCCITAWSSSTNAPFLYRSCFLIDSLSTMELSSSYLEVQRFEVNVACSCVPDVLGSDINILDTSLLFAGNNVDHNIITLDGMGWDRNDSCHHTIHSQTLCQSDCSVSWLWGWANLKRLCSSA